MPLSREDRHMLENMVLALIKDTEDLQLSSKEFVEALELVMELLDQRIVEELEDEP